MKLLLRPIILLTALAALGGWMFFSLPSSASAADTTVPVGSFFFCEPEMQGATCTTTISAGDTVTWEFAGGTHTTTSASGGWDSGNVAGGGTFQHTFAQAGSFSYVCDIHPSLMMGTIVVQAPPAATATSLPSGGTPVRSATPAAGVTPQPPVLNGPGDLPTTGQGPQSGGSDWLLIAALVIAGSAVASAGLALSRRAM